MSFEALNYTPYQWIGFLIFVFALVIAFVLFIASLEIVRNPEKKDLAKKLLIVSAALLISGMVTAIVTTIIGVNVNSSNLEKASRNISAKYEIKEVLWDADETRSDPTTSVEGNRELLVVANNGQQYIFKYDVNKETSEPFLNNMPIQGGNTPDKATTAEALLKK